MRKSGVHDTTAFLLFFNFKLFHQSFEGILSVKAGVGQISLLLIPFGETSVIIHFFRVLDDKRNDTETQTFFQCNQSAYSAVAVLKRMDSLKFVMKINNIVYINTGFGFVCQNSWCSV